jgi:tRNA-specific 2-thiouridylase
VRIRHNAPRAAARIVPESGASVVVEFDRPQRAVTPGQSVVLYDGDVVVGGGIIRSWSSAA